MTVEYLYLLFGVMCLSLMGGVAVGLAMRLFRDEDRDSTARFPRPGTEPIRPKGLRPYRKSPDMLNGDSDD